MIARRPRHSRSSAVAFTLVEVAISVVIVGVLLAASLQAVAMSTVTQYRLAERARAGELARALMVEIVQQAYADPSVSGGAAVALGPESGQARPTFDDVDDYNGFVESPLSVKAGTKLPIPQPATWQRKVAVTWVDPQSLSPAASETGAKMITVTVLHRSKPIVTISAVRTAAP